MKLDSRILEGKKPLDCVDSETAKEFIGKKGYFANYIQAFQDLESTDYQLVYATLKEVDSQRVIAFTDDFDGESSYFLPEEWVKEPEEPEKKYREYNDLDEFFDVTGLEIGDLIKLKFPGNNVAELLIVGGCDNGLFIGIHKYTFKQLFEIVEISINGEWKPFGIEE